MNEKAIMFVEVVARKAWESLSDICMHFLLPYAMSLCVVSNEVLCKSHSRVVDKLNATNL